MKKWHLIVDIEKCEDCNNCFLACKDEHVDNDWPGYSRPQPRHGHRWIDIARKERGQYPLIDVAYRPTMCQHCDNAPCVQASQGVIAKRPDGIVIINPDRANGQKELVKACPYGMIWWNDEQAVPQKCTFCAHLIDQGWQKPRCVQACPTGALRAEYVEDMVMAQMIEAEKLEVLNPDYKTRPSVYYRNLYRLNKCFIAGSVAVEKDGVTDCAEGAKVVLRSAQEKIGETQTDAFGDFKFDGLSENSGEYRIDIEFGGTHEIKIATLKTSLNVGTIIFR